MVVHFLRKVIFLMQNTVDVGMQQHVTMMTPVLTIQL